MKKKGIVRRSECIWHLGTQDNYWHGMFLLRGHTECSRFAREDIDFSIPISDRNTSDSMDAGLFALAWKQETGLPAPLLLVWSRLQLQVAHTFVQVVATTTRYSRTTWYWDYWPEFRFLKKGYWPEVQFSCWTTRNDWIFKNTDPTVNNCKRKFILEMSLLTNRVKTELAIDIESWLQLLM